MCETYQRSVCHRFCNQYMYVHVCMCMCVCVLGKWGCICVCMHHACICVPVHVWDPYTINTNHVLLPEENCLDLCAVILYCLAYIRIKHVD